MNTKMEFPTEWTMPGKVEDGRVDEPRDDSLRLAAGVVDPQDSVYGPRIALINSGFRRIGCLLRRTQVAR